MGDALWPVLSDLTVRNVGPASYGVSMTVIDAEDLDEESASGHVHGICLKTGPPRRGGVELGWLGGGAPAPRPPARGVGVKLGWRVRAARAPPLPVSAGRIAAAVTAFDADRGDLDKQGKRDEE